MMKKSFIVMISLLVLAFHTSSKAHSQSDIFFKLESEKPGQGSVHIVQDNNIRNFINLHLTQQSKLNGIMGYRISIFRSRGQDARTNAHLVRSQFLSKYEGVDCDAEFDGVNWKVYAGLFRTKSEALMFYNKIRNDYPNIAFITPRDIIAFPD